MRAAPNTLDFRIDGIVQTQAVVRILSAQAPHRVSVGGKPLNPHTYRSYRRTILLHFENAAAPQEVRIDC